MPAMSRPRAVFHLVPDFFLRCPVPFVLVSALTVRTLVMMRRRAAGTHLCEQAPLQRCRKDSQERRISIILTVSARLR